MKTNKPKGDLLDEGFGEVTRKAKTQRMPRWRNKKVLGYGPWWNWSTCK